VCVCSPFCACSFEKVKGAGVGGDGPGMRARAGRPPSKVARNMPVMRLSRGEGRSVTKEKVQRAGKAGVKGATEAAVHGAFVFAVEPGEGAGEALYP
jgi:hypothetical protein